MAADDRDTGTLLAEAVARGMYALDSAASGLGIVLDEVRPHHARARMTVTEAMLNSHRICHGGMIFTLADTAFAYACNGENKSTLALSCAIDYLASAALGDELIAVCDVVSRSGRTGVYDVTVSGRGDAKIAVFRGNSYQVNAPSVAGLDATPAR